MGAQVRDAADLLKEAATFLRDLEERPYDHDFYQTLRRLECLHPDAPRIGCALRPADEPVRFAQEPSLAFAPSTLARFTPSRGSERPRLAVSFFGMLGPNGPLPLHLTEYARERMLHAGDHTLPRFLDVIQHRFVELFYRAWAQAQPAVSLDRPREDRVSYYVGALVGIGTPSMRDRDAVADFAKLYFSGLLSRQVRNRDGLTALVAGFFRVRVAVEEFVGHWMELPVSERTRLGADGQSAALGRGTVAGARVWDRQGKIRIHLGPLTLEQYEAFLPGGRALACLIAWVRLYLGYELEWDVSLVLVRDEVPQTRLGSYGRLGWTSWLGAYARAGDARDLCLDAERVAGCEATARSQAASA